MKNMKYVVYQEGKYYVSQCLNVDVASFGKTIDEAVFNLSDAVALYLREDLPNNIASSAVTGLLPFTRCDIRMGETPIDCAKALCESPSSSSISFRCSPGCISFIALIPQW